MYMCAPGFDIALFDDFSIGFWNCSDNMVFYVFILFISEILPSINYKTTVVLHY